LFFKKNIKKNINIGFGFSNDKNPYNAAKQAATKAIKEFTKEPTFTIIYTNSAFNQKEILNGINSVLGKKNWVGISVDKIINSEFGIINDFTVFVLSFDSEFLHFNYSVVENYKKNPKKSGFIGAKKAIELVKGDDCIDPYIQYNRFKSKNYSKIIKTRPFFLMTLVSGIQIKNNKIISAKEKEFIDGIIEYSNNLIPIFSASSSSSMEDYLIENPKNYQFANGKLYENSAIVIFVLCNLNYQLTIKNTLGKIINKALINKVDNLGYEILEINYNDPITEYAKLLGITKKEYLKHHDKYLFSKYFSFDTYEEETPIKIIFPNQKTLETNFKIKENSILNIYKYEKKQTLNNFYDLINNPISEYKKYTPIFALFNSNSERKLFEKDIIQNDYSIINKKFSKIPFFGFYSLNETNKNTSLIIFNELISE
jgi:hypothetical protein